MIDVSNLRVLCTELADRISEIDDSDGFVRSIGIVVELDMGNTTRGVHAFADDRPWVQVALLREFADLIEMRREMALSDNNDD